MFQIQGDAIVSPMPGGQDRSPAQEENMIRFGRRGKKEEAQTDTRAAIRAHLGTRSIVLVGMPGSGKSAVGRRLAARLDLPFVDADEEIERAAGKPITDIFKDHGEAYFREGERKVIARLLSCGPQVLATGGGALMSAETRDNVHRLGISIWLKAELSVLMRRVAKRNTRPLLANDPEGVMRQLMEARYPIYATADLTVESRDLPHDTIVGEIVEALAKSPLTKTGAAGQRSSLPVGEAS
jgi:shikimate kinase